jgi:ATP-binding cassette, subfamily B, bacterial
MLAQVELVDPDILLLDEATAAVRADRVVVLDHGRVMEDGTHTQLLKKNGAYAKLWRAYIAENTVGSPPPRGMSSRTPSHPVSRR